MTTRKAKKHEKLRKAERLARRHKMLIHGALLAGIIISLFLEGGKQADWLFVGLAVVTEVA